MGGGSRISPTQDMHHDASSNPGGQQTGSPQLSRARGSVALSAEQFAAQMQVCRGTLWLVAASIVRDRGEADDVVQEASIIGLSRVHDFLPGSSFVAWMSQIVRNVARNAARKAQRRHKLHTMNAAPGDNPSAHSPTNAAAPATIPDQAFDAKVAAALDSLDEIPRLCLLLRTVGDLSYGHIAQIAGIPEGTAMSHVHRARRSLRERLQDLAGDTT